MRANLVAIDSSLPFNNVSSRPDSVSINDGLLQVYRPLHDTNDCFVAMQCFSQRKTSSTQLDSRDPPISQRLAQLATLASCIGSSITKCMLPLLANRVPLTGCRVHGSRTTGLSLGI